MKTLVLVGSFALLLVGCQPKPVEKVLTFADQVRLAEEGDADAQNTIAMGFLLGRDTERDLERAMHWFQTAADADHPRALYNLGILYQEGKYVPEDHGRSYEYFLKSARRGLPEAQMSLGWLYEGGLGTEKDIEEAVYWYRRAATYGKAAQRTRSYYTTHLLDHRDSQYLYGNRDAQFLLGKLFEEGNESLAQDLDMAVDWYEDAAVRGDGPSAARLAVLLGLQGKPHADPVMGYAWAKVAHQSQQVSETEQIVASIKRSLSAETLNQAEAESAELLRLIEYNQSNL